MSNDFQKKVFGELLDSDAGSRKAAAAGIRAILLCAGQRETGGGGKCRIVLETARIEPLIKLFTLLKKTFNISVESDLKSPEKSGMFESGLYRYEVPEELVQAVMKMTDGSSRKGGAGAAPAELSGIAADEKSTKCFLQCCFLCTGSVRDPLKDYYLSFAVSDRKTCAWIQQLLEKRGVTLKAQQQGRRFILVTRGAEVIADLLNLLGASSGMMDVENAMIMREVRGKVNRKVNCETANIMKTVTASSRQLEEIRMIRNSSIWESLPESLRQTAVLREQYPDSSLQELGEKLNPPIGKSGVNHRLRRLSAIADGLRRDE